MQARHLLLGPLVQQQQHKGGVAHIALAAEAVRLLLQILRLLRRQRQVAQKRLHRVLQQVVFLQRRVARQQRLRPNELRQRLALQPLLLPLLRATGREEVHVLEEVTAQHAAV